MISSTITVTFIDKFFYLGEDLIDYYLLLKSVECSQPYATKGGYLCTFTSHQGLLFVNIKVKYCSGKVSFIRPSLPRNILQSN